MKLLKHLLMIILVCSSGALWAQRKKIDPITLGNVTLGEERSKIDFSQFLIVNQGRYPLEAKVLSDTVQWVRMDEVLLVPRVLMDVTIPTANSHITLGYADQKIIPLFDSVKQQYHARIFISIFESLPLEVYEKSVKVNTLRLIPGTQKSSNKHLIDYSCAKYSIELKGLEEDYVSVGCRLQRTGKFGNERPHLEVYLTSASFRLKDQAEPPYVINFHQSGQAQLNLTNYKNEEGRITVSAKLPEHLPRLKLAGGFGPYSLDTSSKSGQDKFQVAPTFMLYGNLTLNESSSFRFFDSFSKSVSTFHNWGTYFAWDLAEFCDKRCLITSLIGLQGVQYEFNSNAATSTEMILPQGFEFVFKHPFGQLNHIFAYGMFASLSGVYNYQNIWIRYGKQTFWELNLIEWKRDKRSATMVGLSYGFPLGSFF
jgi:hypothetical protein